MIHFVLHDPKDTVAVVVVEGVKAGQDLTGWIMDEDRTVSLRARQDIPIGHKLALKDISSGETIIMGGLLRDEDIVEMQKVPLFSEIPIIGELFKRRKTSKASSQVIISITPAVIKPKADEPR